MTQEEKINVAELLKDCPKGMELDCVMYDNVAFECVKQDEPYPINVKIKEPPMTLSLSKTGGWNSYDSAKCVIFPKGKTTWEGFVPPYKFKDGDIVATTDGRWIGITMGGKKSEFIPTYCVIQCDDKFEAYLDRKGEWAFNRLATKEEKAKLFRTIKDNGYRWNPETKTLERLTPNKFDITTLKPFDKVLVRDTNTQKWTADIFSFFDKSHVYPYVCVGHYTNQCIPYEGNEHLLGATDDCDEYFKTW